VADVVSVGGAWRRDTRERQALQQVLRFRLRSSRERRWMKDKQFDSIVFKTDVFKSGGLVLLVPFFAVTFLSLSRVRQRNHTDSCPKRRKTCKDTYMEGSMGCAACGGPHDGAVNMS